MNFFAYVYLKIKNFIKQFIIPTIKSGDMSLTIPKDERFSNKPLKFYKTPIGNYYLPADATNDVIALDMKAGNIFESEIVDIARKYIRNNSTVLDIGANFGQMSLYFSQFTGENGQVFSFEADDYVFHILQKNIRANNCQNIRAFLRAVYDKGGNIMFYPVQDFKRFPTYGSYGLDPNATSGRGIETIAIDDLNIESPISFMKVDVQGSDLFAMRGAVETIKRHQMPIIFEFEQQFQNEFGTTFQDYLDFINSISYKAEQTVYGINYLIVPDTKKYFAQPADFSAATGNVQINPVTQSQANAKNSTNLHIKSHRSHLCKFLRSRAEIEECTLFLHHNGFVSHDLKCKNWDLAHIIPEIGDGNFLDMGSSDSYILENLALKKIRGEKYGVDLREPNSSAKGVKYMIGDMTDTKLPDKFFKNITCLSVIEHGVDFKQFVNEVSRLLEDNGKLFVTFDYWNPKITSPMEIYGLSWQPLDEQSVRTLINECEEKGIYLVEDMDWTTNETVIHYGYYSPHPGMSYTFGLTVFEKR